MQFVFGLLIATWSWLLIAWLALHWFILPHIQQWRAPIEARASRALGVTVKIGRIDVRSSGWVPGLELHDVVLLDSAQRVALKLPRIVAALSPRSLLAFDLRFEQLLIEGPELDVRRDVQGRLFVAGLDFGGTGGSDDGRAADWFFQQGEFVIRGGSLRWTDEQRGAAPLALTDVQLVIRNTLRNHAIRLDASPPVEWGDRFTVSGRFAQRLLERSGDWKRWSGSGYASLPRADVRELRRHVDLPFELSEGNGALRAWFDLQEGVPRVATVDVALREVSMRLAPDVEPLTVERVEGRLEARRDDDNVALALRDFAFVTGDGVAWPRGDLSLGLKQRDGAAPTGGVFSAQRLDVGVMAQIATRLPLGSTVRRLLDELKPQGLVSDLAAQWEGPVDAPDKYDVKAALSGVSFESRNAREAHDVGRPGLRNAAIDLHANEAGGDARISVANGALDLPGVFAEQRVPLDQLSAALSWKVDHAKGAGAGAEPKLSVMVKDARFANPDAHGELTAAWSSGDSADKAHGGRFPGRLELD
ncbi:MAG: TIGR02099 family protein, partial [Caldimonas sp.]